MFEGVATESFLSTEEEWHYFAGGAAAGMIAGILLGALLVMILIWMGKKKDNPRPERRKKK